MFPRGVGFQVKLLTACVCLVTSTRPEVNLSARENPTGDIINFNAIASHLDNMDPDVKKAAKKVTEGSIELLGSIDWEIPILPQLQEFATSTFLASFGMVNPLLGLAVTIFVGLFFQDDNDADIFDAIKERVAGQIKSALNEFYQTLLVNDMAGVMNLMFHSKAREDWSEISQTLVFLTPSFFSSDCWWAKYPDDHPGCQEFRRKKGRGEGLMLSKEFVRTMLSVFYSLVDYEINQEKQLAGNIAMTMPLLYGYYQDWRDERLQPDNFVKGRWWEGGPGYLVEQGQDLYLHDSTADRDENNTRGGGEFSGTNCVPSSFSHRRRTYYPDNIKITYRYYDTDTNPCDPRCTERRLTHDLGKCRTDWMAKIDRELKDMRKEINHELIAGVDIVNRHRTLPWLKHNGRSASSACGGGWAIAETQDECVIAANLSMAGIRPRYGPYVGRWSWVPTGCSVRTRGDWAIHWNTEFNGANHGDYSVVCVPSGFKYSDWLSYHQQAIR